MAEPHLLSRPRHLREASLSFRVCGLLAFLALLFPEQCRASTCYSYFSTGQYPFCEQLSPNVSLHWVVQGGTIIWALDVDGTWDWVGVGISEGGMHGADIAVAAHDARAQQWAVADYWSAASGPPQLDKQQDVTLMTISRHAQHGSMYGSTRVALRRPLVTCGPFSEDHPILEDTRQNVIFAYGNGGLQYHGTSNRGEHSIVLVPNKTATVAPSSSGTPLVTKTLDLQMPAGFIVPVAPTSYKCVNLALPNDTKYHIYRYEPLIDNRPLVHHFVAYTCRGGDAVPVGGEYGIPYDCLHDMECKEFFIGWAPGVEAVDAPTQAALAFGVGTGVNYLVLQIHYTNLDSLAGQTDSSGFRLTYSSILKKYDMGVLTLGSYDISIPPGAASWTAEPNVCPGTCTAKMAAGGADGGITLVQSFYHMHELGRSMVTRHVRGGWELPPLGARNYFAFEYQAPVDIPPGARQLLPGDTLITTCTYSGVGRTNITGFGLASYQEMCFNFLTYYPYNALVSSCISLGRQSGLAMCTTFGATSHFTGNITAAAEAGLVVLVPRNLTFRPYQPACLRSIAAGSSGDGAIQDGGGDDDDNHSGGSPHHKRNVGAAVAAILIVTIVGAIAIVAVYRAMKKKRQAEEEQHLFEKYNPNSVFLPIVAGNLAPSAAGSIVFGSVIGSSSAAAVAPPKSPGNTCDGIMPASGAVTATMGSSLGGGGKGYSALPTQITGA